MNQLESPLPTAETTQFADSRTVVAAGLLADYISANQRRPKALKELERFAKDPQRRNILFSYIFDLYQNAMHTSTPDEQRIGTYESLIRHFDSISVFPHKGAEDYREEDPIHRTMRVNTRRMYELERSSRKVPQEVITLTNQTVSESYPQDFGSVIPVLDASDIYVVTDASFKNHLKPQQQQRELHPAARAEIEKLNPHIDLDSTQDVRFLVNQRAFGKPVTISDGTIRMLEAGQKLSDDGSMVVANARSLIHESFHRSQQLTIVEDPTVYDLLFQYSRTDAHHIIGLLKNSPTQQDLYKAYMQVDAAVIEEARKRDLVFAVDGARIFVMALDEEDGSLKTLMQSGYDINEALTDYFVADPIKSMVDQYKRAHSLVMTESPELEELGNISTIPEASYQRNNYAKDVKGYLAALGLSDKRQALQAFATSRIPVLHAQRLPGRPYFT